MEYKIGDRVQVITDVDYDVCQVGKYGTVVAIRDYSIYVKMDGFTYTETDPSERNHLFWGSELELVQKVPVKVILNSDICMPKYGSVKAAGADLIANIDYTLILKPLCRSIVPTGVSMELPEGYEAQIRPRSGLAAKKGLSVLNSPGTIDEDYRGEVKVILINLSNETITINPNERIAQMVITPYVQGDFKLEEELTETERGEGGLGSTGIL